MENRESNDERSLGELFLYFSVEMSDITWIQDPIADEEIDKLVDA